MGGVLKLTDANSLFALPAKMDASVAHQLKDSLLEHRSQSLSIDASDVQQISTLCLQVLLSAQKSWRRDGHDIGVENPSPAFRDSVVPAWGRDAYFVGSDGLQDNLGRR